MLTMNIYNLYTLKYIHADLFENSESTLSATYMANIFDTLNHVYYGGVKIIEAEKDIVMETTKRE